LWLPFENLRQLGDVHGDAPSLIFAEQLGRRSSPRLILKVDVGDLLAVVVALPDDG
jgi:hypothetical protein